MEYPNFSNPEEWLKCICWFQQFCLASGLSEKSFENQVHTLVYVMGDTVDLCLVSQMMVRRNMRQKFEGHFVKNWNVTFECAKYNQRTKERVS